MWPPRCASTRRTPAAPWRGSRRRHDADRGDRQRPADRAWLPGPRAVEREGRTRFGEAVALEHLDPRPVEEVGQPLAERAAAAERESHAPAKDGLQLPVDEAIEHGVLDRRDRTVPSRHVVSGPSNGHLDRLVEDRAMAFGVRLALGAVEDLLEDPGHGDHHRGAHHRQLLLQVRRVAGERQLDAPLGPDQGDDLGQHVCQRQEQEGDLRASSTSRSASMFCSTFACRLRWVRAHPFGRPVVPDVYTIVATASVPMPVIRASSWASSTPAPAAFELGEAALVDHERLPTGRRLGRRPPHRAHRRRLGDGQNGATVADDPLQLLGRRCLINGHGQPAGGEDRVVGEQPLEPGVRHEGDAVSGVDATGHQTLGEPADPVVEFAGCHVDELVTDPEGRHGPTRLALGPLDDRL